MVAGYLCMTVILFHISFLRRNVHCGKISHLSCRRKQSWHGGRAAVVFSLHHVPGFVDQVCDLIQFLDQ